MIPTVDDPDCARSMPFQERVAWLTLLSAVVVYGSFLRAALAGDHTVLRVVVLFTIAITVQGVSIAIAKPLLALRDPAEAKAPLDERDKDVAREAFRAAYLALMGAVVLVAMSTPYASEPWQLTLLAYAATIVADLVRMAAIIVGYRRTHG